MAADTPKPPEGFREESGGGDDGDVPTVNGDRPLEPGEVLQGIVLDLVEGESARGPWYRLRIKDDQRGVVDYFAKDRVKVAAANEKIEIGEPIWIAKAVEEREFENNDGETVSYVPTRVAFPE